MLQPFIKSIISSTLFLLVGITCKSQIKMAYNIGSLGNSGSIAPLFSGSVIIDTASCFSLSNGVKKLQATGSGIFTSGCQLLVNNVVEMKLVAYPNPVVSSLYIKATNDIRTTTTNDITIELRDVQGRLIKAFSTTIASLITGYEIKMNEVKPGIYFIRIVTDNTKVELIKIFKS